MINWTYILDKTEDITRQDFSQFFDTDWVLKDEYLALDEYFVLYKKCFWVKEYDVPTIGYDRIFYFCLKEELMNAINDCLIEIPDDSPIHNPYIIKKDERFGDGYFLFDSPDLLIQRSPYYLINEYIEVKVLNFIEKENYEKLLPRKHYDR